MGKLNEELKENTEKLGSIVDKVKRLKEVEEHLRKKCKRYKKHIKGLQRGVEWRNELITELLFRLGYNDEEVVLSSEDFKKLLVELGYEEAL